MSTLSPVLTVPKITNKFPDLVKATLDTWWPYFHRHFELFCVLIVLNLHKIPRYCLDLSQFLNLCLPFSFLFCYFCFVFYHFSSSFSLINFTVFFFLSFFLSLFFMLFLWFCQVLRCIWFFYFQQRTIFPSHQVIFRKMHFQELQLHVTDSIYTIMH